MGRVRVLFAVLIVFVTAVTLYFRWQPDEADRVAVLTEIATASVSNAPVDHPTDRPYSGSKAVVESGVGSVTLANQLIGHPTQTVTTVVQISCYSNRTGVMATAVINDSDSGAASCSQADPDITTADDIVTGGTIGLTHPGQSYDADDGISVTVTTSDDPEAVIAVRFTVQIDCAQSRDNSRGAREICAD